MGSVLPKVLIKKNNNTNFVRRTMSACSWIWGENQISTEPSNLTQ